MNGDTRKCLQCGATRLMIEIDPVTGNGPCCPTSKKKPQEDRGLPRTRADPADQTAWERLQKILRKEKDLVLR